MPPTPVPYSAPAPSTAPMPPPAPGLRTAHWYTWGVVAYFVIVVGIGIGWDGYWHATHRFDTFFSPPHIFIYANVLITALLVANLTFRPRLRPWFGPGFRVFPFPFEVPGPLFLTGSGLVLLGLAGGLDFLWHTNFGLDETNWSTPHAMIGWALCLTTLGLISCRLALRGYLPLHWYSALVLGGLALTFSAAPFLGPFHERATPAVVSAIAHIPVLLGQASAQHAFRIALAWDLTRTSPVFLLLASLWAGTVLAFARQLDRRGWLYLLVFALYTLATLISSHRAALRLDHLLGTHIAQMSAAWLPIPLLAPAALLTMLILIGVPDRISWPIAGVAFAACVYAIWGVGVYPAALIALAAPLALLGLAAGEWAYRTLSQPTRERAWLLVGVCATVPFIVGCVDLYLRFNTP